MDVITVLITAWRTLLGILAAVSLYILGDLWITGRAIARTPMMQTAWLGHHRRRFWAIVANTTLTIALVEVVGRFLLGVVHPPYPPIFWVHLLCFATPFIILLAVIGLGKDGVKDQKRHGIYARWCLVLGAITQVTGVIVALRVGR